jgi:hypothetical protein
LSAGSFIRRTSLASCSSPASSSSSNDFEIGSNQNKTNNGLAAGGARVDDFCRAHVAGISVCANSMESIE